MPLQSWFEISFASTPQFPADVICNSTSYFDVHKRLGLSKQKSHKPFPRKWWRRSSFQKLSPDPSLWSRTCCSWLGVIPWHEVPLRSSRWSTGPPSSWSLLTTLWNHGYWGMRPSIASCRGVAKDVKVVKLARTRSYPDHFFVFVKQCSLKVSVTVINKDVHRFS